MTPHAYYTRVRGDPPGGGSVSPPHLRFDPSNPVKGAMNLLLANYGRLALRRGVIGPCFASCTRVNGEVVSDE